MKKEISAKHTRSFTRRLHWAVCILLTLVVVSAWSVCGVYAKYINSASVDASAGIAPMGIKVFRLTEHRAEDISDDLDKVAETGALYELTEETVSAKEGNVYSKVIPGVDIPKDPFIELELSNSAVHYELYVKVTEKGFSKENLPEKDYRDVDYKVTSEWFEESVEETETGRVITYKFVGERDGVKSGVFVAGTPYSFVIDILEGNKIKVSERYNSEPVDGEPHTFSLTFVAYLQQVLNVPED